MCERSGFYIEGGSEGEQASVTFGSYLSVLVEHFRLTLQVTDKFHTDLLLDPY